MDINNPEFINDCANWHSFYEIYHYAMKGVLYNLFPVYVKLGFLYFTMCQNLLYIFIKVGF